jgi:sulfate/thiosulfate transport system permease protein
MSARPTASVASAIAVDSPRGREATRPRHATADPPLLRGIAIGLALLFLGVVVVLPLAAIFTQAFAGGVGRFVRALITEEMQAAIGLTLVVSSIAVVLNTVFGVAAAWLVTRHTFRGKSLLVSLIDLPFSVSPVISGLVFVLLFGRRGVLGPWLEAHDVKIVFAIPGLVLATTFVTFPFVARELIPLMESQGKVEEEAALTLGASGWQTFVRVTLPKIKWGLFYGIVLCNARAMGEFGAVSVVSGHVRGRTTTIPLHVEILYDEYDFVGAFAAASVLTILGVATTIAKKWIETRSSRRGGES